MVGMGQGNRQQCRIPQGSSACRRAEARHKRVLPNADQLASNIVSWGVCVGCWSRLLLQAACAAPTHVAHQAYQEGLKYRGHRWKAFATHCSQQTKAGQAGPCCQARSCANGPLPAAVISHCPSAGPAPSPGHRVAQAAGRGHASKPKPPPAAFSGGAASGGRHSTCHVHRTGGAVRQRAGGVWEIVVFVEVWA